MVAQCKGCVISDTGRLHPGLWCGCMHGLWRHQKLHSAVVRAGMNAQIESPCMRVRVRVHGCMAVGANVQLHVVGALACTLQVGIGSMVGSTGALDACVCWQIMGGISGARFACAARWGPRDWQCMDMAVCAAGWGSIPTPGQHSWQCNGGAGCGAGWGSMAGSAGTVHRS